MYKDDHGSQVSVHKENTKQIHDVIKQMMYKQMMYNGDIVFKKAF